jgi:hypothetical protein
MAISEAAHRLVTSQPAIYAKYRHGYRGYVLAFVCPDPPKAMSA